MKRKFLAGLAVLVAVPTMLAISGCGDDDGGDGAASSDIKVGLAYDLGGRGDKSFNDAAALGLDKAKADLGVTGRDLSPSKEEDRVENLKLLASEGFDPVIGVGFAFETPIKDIATANPNTTFATIDTVVDLPNVKSNIFAEEQGSFLVGAAAALKSKSNNVGFIGGVEISLIKKFEAGFTAGVKQVKPNAKVQIKYITPEGDFSGFNSPDKAKEIAGAMYEAGADVIFHAAGGSGGGLFDAAVAAGDGKWAIGVDSDQYLSATAEQQKHILTSMLKRVDVAVFKTVEDFSKGDKTGGTKVFDLSVDGVGYSTSGGYLDDIVSQLDDLKAKVVAGEITVPTEPTS